MNKQEAIKEAAKRWPNSAHSPSMLVSVRGRAGLATRYAVGKVYFNNGSSAFRGYGKDWETAFANADKNK